MPDQTNQPADFSLSLSRRIESEADPVGFLIRLARGEGFEAAPSASQAVELQTVYPTLDQRIKAQTLLEKRLMEATDKSANSASKAPPSKTDISALRTQLAQEITRLIESESKHSKNP